MSLGRSHSTHLRLSFRVAGIGAAVRRVVLQFVDGRERIIALDDGLQAASLNPCLTNASSLLSRSGPPRANGAVLEFKPAVIDGFVTGMTLIICDAFEDDSKGREDPKELKVLLFVIAFGHFPQSLVRKRQENGAIGLTSTDVGFRKRVALGLSVTWANASALFALRVERYLGGVAGWKLRLARNRRLGRF
jgi:hypothetical protein